MNKNCILCTIMLALASCSPDDGRPNVASDAHNTSSAPTVASSSPNPTPPIVSTASAVAIAPTSNPQQRLNDAQQLQKMLQQHAHESRNRPQVPKSEQQDAQKVRDAALADMAFFRQQTTQLRDLALNDAETIKVRDKLVQSREISADVLEKILSIPNEQARFQMMVQTAPEMERSVALQEEALEVLARLLKE